jgi:undecaprenyl-diphosphatase
VDFFLLRQLNGYAAGHDGMEDVVKAYVGVSEILFAGLLVLGFLMLGRTGRRAAVSAGASAGLALLIAHFTALLVERPRPFVAHPETVHLFLAHARDPSFPSEHATAAFAIAMAIWLRHRGAGAVVLVLASVLALGRVALGLHYPVDVVGGALLGMACALGLYAAPVRARLDALADAAGRVYGRVVRSSS